MHEHTPASYKLPRTRRRAHLLHFEVQSLDVWGNAEEGYEINAAYRCGSFELYGRQAGYGGDYYANDAAVQRAFMAGYLHVEPGDGRILHSLVFDFGTYPLITVSYADEPDRPVWHVFATDTVEEKIASDKYWASRG